MNLSFWEKQTWFSDVDFAIIGSGIVGLNCALRIRESNKTAKIIILEKGLLPSGASTKNAGFASFGSLSEILEDLKYHSEEEVISLVRKRAEGLRLLRKNLGDSVIDYQEYGGFELFTQREKDVFLECREKIEAVNELLFPIFNAPVYSFRENFQGFQNIIDTLVYNQFEGQIDTGRMMNALLQKCVQQNIQILNNSEVTEIADSDKNVELVLNNSFSFRVKKVAVATNGFTQKILPLDVQPARGQVLVTKPIPNLKLKGTYHFDRGYYYFRNIDNRVLFGGGRNLDFQGEQTEDFGITDTIQNTLDTLLKEVILPDTHFEIDHRWSGIMGMGSKKIPIVQQISSHVFCGVRLSGIGVAIGTQVGNELAEMVMENSN